MLCCHAPPQQGTNAEPEDHCAFAIVRLRLQVLESALEEILHQQRENRDQMDRTTNDLRSACNLHI